MLAGLIGSASLLVRRRAGPAAREPALACLLMFASGVSVLLVSDVFEFSWRYLLPALVTLVPAGALGIGVVIRAAQARRAAGGAPGASTGPPPLLAAVLPPSGRAAAVFS